MARVRALELPARFGELGQALHDVGRALDAAPPCDLLLLPECSLTGYVDARGRFDLSAFGEPLGGPTTRHLAQLAAGTNTHIAAPLIERDGERCFNSFVVVRPSGEIALHHRKRHPWYPETWATPGDRPFASFELHGLQLSLGICFDVHFLETEAAEVLARSDVLLFPSAWVDDTEEDGRAPIFASLVQRFGLTIVNANWGEGTPRIAGQGGSRIVTPDGATICEPGGSVDAIIAPKTRAV